MNSRINPSLIRHILRSARPLLCQNQNQRSRLSTRPALWSLSSLQGLGDPHHQSQLLRQKDGRDLSLKSGRRFISNTTKEFQDAVARSTHLKSADSSTKLKLYSLFKQSTEGKNKSKKPGMLDLVGKAKWEAWNTLGDMSQAEAQKVYVDTINSLFEAESTSGGSTSEEGDGFAITVEKGVRTIKLNRPAKKNALTMDMYNGIAKALRDANDDDSTTIVVLTGTGDYFCSGNDLATFMKATDPAAMAKKGKSILQDYIDSYIYCKKPLIALVNGPAVGIAVTVLGLCDIVYATDKATFTSPFSSLGQSPEGCSSYLFPRIMGYAKASELLYFNQKFSAAQAEQCGLLTQVFPDDRLQAEAWKRIHEMAELPVKSLVFSKELVRGRERALLHEVNVAECVRLEERWQSEDCMNAIMKFFSKKSKL